MAPPKCPTRRLHPGRALEAASVGGRAVVDGVTRFARDMDRARTLGLAAELAFWLFLSLIPLITVAGMIAAKLAVGNASWLDQALSSVPIQTRRLIREQLDQVAAWNGGSVGTKAALVFLWLGSSGIHAVFELFEIKVGARRPWWKRRLLAIATCVALSVGVALLTILATGLDWIEAVVRGVLPHIAWLERGTGAWSNATRLAVAFCTSVALATGLYWVGIPSRRRRTMPLLPGAVLAVVAHFVLGAAYVAYLREIGVGGAYQASLAVIGVTLMALYIFSVALLMGAQLNCTLAHWPSEPPPPLSTTPPSAPAEDRLHPGKTDEAISP